MNLPGFLQNRWVLLALSILFALMTAAIILFSLEDIRAGFSLGHLIRQLDSRGEQGDYGAEYQQDLLDASQFARRPREWSRLIRLAWDLPEPERWTLIMDLSEPAVQMMPRDSRWRIIGGYAALRRGENERAAALLSGVRPAGELTQLLLVVSAVEPSNRSRSLEGLDQLSRSGEPLETVATIFQALRDDSVSALMAGWEATGVEAFLLNAALSAAARGDGDTLRQLLPELRATTSYPRSQATIAGWVGDDDWLFSVFQQLPPREAVSPPMLHLQAESLVRTGRVDAALELYREIQRVAPGYSHLPFLNEAVFLFRAGDAGAEDAALAGLESHPGNPDLLHTLAVLRLGRGDLDSARELLEPLRDDDTGLHRSWLLARILGYHSGSGSIASLERLESDLWRYVNRFPDADPVVGFLARLLAVRRDISGLDEIRRRYGPHTSTWTRTAHLLEADRLQRPDMMEALLEGPETWADRYNRALFALRFLPETLARQEIAGLRRWLERSVETAPGQKTNREVLVLMLEAELYRFYGDRRDVLERVDRAIELAPAAEALYSYRAVVDGQR